MSVALLLTAFSALAGTLPDVDRPLKTGAKAAADAAVVIGLEDYVFVADVPYAKRDARAFYDFLVYTRGVPAANVRLFEGSGGREQIEGAIEKAAGQVGDGGTLWVYFAGHGAADTSSGERILLGDDVRQDPAAFEARAVKLAKIQEIAAGKDLMLLLDACYNGMGRGGEELVSGKRYLVPTTLLEPAAGRAEWSASAPDQLAGPLHAVEHGAFTYFAIGALRGWADGEIDGKRDGKVTAEEADLYVKSALRSVQVTTQTPVLSVSNASTRVLSMGTERAPVLEAPTTAPAAPAPAAAPAPVAAPNPSLLDPNDHALMDKTLLGIVDRCTAQNRTSNWKSDGWTVRFKTKKSKPSWLMIGDTNMAADFDAASAAGADLPDMDPGRSARGMCIRREIKQLRFARDGVVVQRTMHPTR